MKFRLLALTLLAALPCRAVDYPGDEPGEAKASLKNDVITLENRALRWRWKIEEQAIKPLDFSSQEARQSWHQENKELFRLRTRDEVPALKDGFYLGIRRGAQSYSAVFSVDGQNWQTLQSWPREKFSAIAAVRVGKMSLAADATDYASAGGAGACRIEEIKFPLTYAPEIIVKSPRAGTTLELQKTSLKITAAANSVAFAEWPMPRGTVGAARVEGEAVRDPNLFSCRIWKDSDKGESWGPGIALIFSNGQFILVNARIPLGDFSTATREGEALHPRLQVAPAFDVAASEFRLVGEPQVKRVGDAQQVTATLKHPQKALQVEWRATLRDEAHYVRQTVTLRGQEQLFGVELLDCVAPGAQQVGTVPGSPVAGNGCFFGVELPMGQNAVTEDGFRTSFACRLPLDAATPYEFSSVAGVYPQGQLRRAFLAYIERERARPTKPFLHYNCWYDLAQRVNEKDLLSAIGAFHEEFTAKRGVKLDSYVIDDGWDDARNTFWGVDKTKFPNGFAPIAAALKERDSHLGIWISPLAGYGEAQQRIANARKLGLTDNTSLDLSNPVYYKWYRDECLRLMRDYGVNYFKWDKAGSGVGPHFMALTRLARELRQTDPNLFINVTVGTWPSPFWLNHIDATWRDGGDMGWTGAGNKREQWLNYRDMELYRRVAQRAPLYPLNSIMHHGVVLGRFYQGGEVAVAGPDLRHDARLYFANGAALQELYLMPSLMTPQGWDDVAAAAKWGRENADVLADAHWMGGDPGKGEIYGYASWAPRKGVFVLRNPADKPGTIELDAAQIFELPAGAKRRFTLRTPYADQKLEHAELTAGRKVQFSLAPFDVLVFEAIPR